MNYLFLVLTSFFTCADQGEFTFRGQDYQFDIQDHWKEGNDEAPASYVSISWGNDPLYDDSGRSKQGAPAQEAQSIWVYLEMVEEGELHIYGFVRQDPIYEVFLNDPDDPQRWVSAEHEFTFTRDGVGIDGAKPIKFPKLNVKTTRL
jgi:hypothetical protein